MFCGTQDQQSQSEPGRAYSLVEVANHGAPGTVAALERRLAQWVGDSAGYWRGKLFVAKTIWLDRVENAFCQGGCSPNYRGGLWTLTSCKHTMRATKTFREAIAASAQCPFMVFTLSNRADDGRQYLVSVAMVTEWFETMAQYAAFLRQHGTPMLQHEKLSHPRSGRAGLGKYFGDCHVSERGRIKRPSRPHVHAGPKADRDLDGSHLLLASCRFIVWRKPLLSAKTLLAHEGYGVNVAAGQLAHWLVDHPPDPPNDPDFLPTKKKAGPGKTGSCCGFRKN